ncbi:hypothetical protein [Streptomyces sp. NPDC050856]|uniref:SCO4225 family membrane protein n=1 Tax=Streptomyces sp. NPDC050856 TaxID=3154939 RepID=UPI0033EE3143
MIARKLFRIAFANPFSAVYLGVVGAVAVFEVIAALIEGPQEFAGLYVLMVTSPTALLLMEFAEAIGGFAKPSQELSVVTLAVSAVLQSLTLGLLWKLVRSERAKPGRAQHS